VLEDVQAIEGPNKRSRSTPASGASVLQLGVILALAPSLISLPRYPYRVGLNNRLCRICDAILQNFVQCSGANERQAAAATATNAHIPLETQAKFASTIIPAHPIDAAASRSAAKPA
jgi:hypothetical protein